VIDVEERMKLLKKKAQKKKDELECLRKRPQLSPQSKRRELSLEKQVFKMQKDIEIGKSNYAEFQSFMD